ncbi:hypothetical protein Mgra_00008774 [Meloidogyne graminicola]|uniref:phenylalanine--tRNA ligase n=1 Tax=Meloidogyne graminicola TaxID=189291 RepID=A0A8S9ZEW1_9BILA|nr:hypothetical protein Mgra_00008774 [Meloidogyne graminicola]
MKIFSKLILLNYSAAEHLNLRYIHIRPYSLDAKNKIIKDDQKPSAVRFDAPSHFELDGRRVATSPDIWNISTRIEQLLQRRLLKEEGNPLNLLKRKITDYFNLTYRKPRASSPLFAICENEPRLVDVFENFDSLLIPKAHPSRRTSDTYYASDNFCLRAHTSAHQFELLKKGLDNFLVIGDVYRRDEIDKTHFPCFHQIEGVRTYAPHELFGRDSPMPFFEGIHSDYELLRTDNKQETHTDATAKLLETELKKTLENLCQAIFSNAETENKLQMRWESTYFPFTHPSFELQVFFEDKWLEVLGCGIMEQSLLDSAGAGERVGWAFGLGLERLAMILYGIPDIRLFWSYDSGFVNQFKGLNPSDIVKYKQISKQPQLFMDLSFWLPEHFEGDVSIESLRSDVFDVIRMIGDDLIEQFLMDEPILALISLTLFVGSYFSGCIPLFFTLNEKRIRIASIFGAGLLVGTALCVIIPEGISALMEASNSLQNSQSIVNQPQIPAKMPEQVNAMNIQKLGVAPLVNDDHQLRNQRNDEKLNEKIKVGNVNVKEENKNLAKIPKKREAPIDKNHPTFNLENNQSDKHNKVNHKNIDGQIGFPLLIGFLFMFVIEQLTKMGAYGRNSSKSVSTIGLVIHAFADGIAMGSASSAGSKLEMQILVFVAIMLHKAPAAFALVSILLAQGLDKIKIRRHLLIFSLAAPIGTVVTYVLIQMTSPSSIDGQISETPSTSGLTGLILLFSAGTFLYIATVHVMPELMESRCSSTSTSGINGSRELLLGGLSQSSGRTSIFDILIFCISALIPAIISSFTHGGGHGHK